MNKEQMPIAELQAPIVANTMLPAVPFTHLGLFEGIGGFSLAAKWMGWETLAWCEWNEFGQKVLNYHFPKAEGFGDITKTDFTKYANTIDILTGGFPCQPYSVAGKQLGTEDERHLWPEMLRAIREVQPCYVVGENVSGLVNWNGGLVFEQVQIDLANEGYEILPVILPACAINAPHRRDRVWFIAYSHNARTNRRSGTNRERETENERRQGQPQFEHRTNGSDGVTENTDKVRWGGNKWKEETNEWQQRQFSTRNNEPIPTNYGEVGIDTNTTGIECNGNNKHYNGISGQEQREFGGIHSKEFSTHTKCSGGREMDSNIQRGQSNGNGTNTTYEQNNWSSFPTQSPLCGGDDGLPKELDSITFPKWRTESIKAYGNAIVPGVAFQIFKALESVHGHSR
jgi:DNA (cytosine-5)-methyltransferase 1